MSTLIYYFSGTGNSLKVAKDLAGQLKDTRLVQINKDNMNVCDENMSGKVGIVFPVYYYGLPVVVKNFVENLTIHKDAYLFAIATCGGSVGASMRQINNVLAKKQLELSAAFRIIMPDNYQVLYSPPPIEKQQKLFVMQKQIVDEIAKTIENNERVKFQEKGKYFSKIFGGLISGIFKPGSMDKNFWTDENCNGCSICSKVCPVSNIKMNGQKPEWNHHCEHCLACMQWCPKESIQYKKGTINRPRYHHHDIKVQEMFKNSER